MTKSWLNHSRGEGIRDSMEQYQTLREKHQAAYDKLNKRYTIVSWLRLVVALALAMSVYQYFQEENTILLIISFLCLVGFLALLKFHSILLNKKNFEKALVEINEDEIAYLRGESIPFHKGEEFVDQKHLFSYDLDFFGEHSLFHNLNRTATYFGKTHFKDQLLNLLTIDEIRLNQSALKELAKKLELRQKMRAFGKLAQDNKKEYDALLNWSNDKPENINQAWVFLGYILPVIFSISTIIYFLSYNPLAFAIFKFSFFANLGFLAVHLKQIRKELINGDGMARVLQQYGLIIQQLEDEDFQSKKLQSIQNTLKNENGKCSQFIKELAKRMSDLESIQNGFAAIIFNGAILYHFHSFLKVLNWKKQHSDDIKNWLEIIGEMESLCSLANLYLNNPHFAFPELNDNLQIELQDLGHPLIHHTQRICNDVDFNSHSFIVLTGSNMSGKSTFLRTLGINMVLAGIGSPICATKANIHPLPVAVSMRQSDSLLDGESYFFAEVKRLKKIVEHLKSQTSFVLLDEILRGTNSTDKRKGTIEVIKKIISYQTIGAIATHDLEVCQISKDFPDKLTNKCFEGEIKKDELYFDYKLKDGICKSQTATFLMRKEGIF